MDPRIAPLWRDLETFAHRVCGVAVTVRYVPTNKRASRASPEEFTKFEGRWYRELSPEPFVGLLREGSVVVIDGHEDGDTGTIGSNNIMLWKTRGAVGVVTSGGARDTDEIIKEKIPLYSGLRTDWIRAWGSRRGWLIDPPWPPLLTGILPG
jgi:4-hydroxy-4-methyl-2-oxoglutarate aldolase